MDTGIGSLQNDAVWSLAYAFDRRAFVHINAGALKPLSQILNNRLDRTVRSSIQFHDGIARNENFGSEESRSLSAEEVDGVVPPALLSRASSLG